MSTTEPASQTDTEAAEEVPEATPEESPPRGALWRSSWWARRHPEQPLERSACPRSDCRQAPIGDFDLYCGNAREPHFLLLGADRRLQVTAVYAVRSLLALLALIAAASASRLPLYGDAAIVGLLVLALPLRRFPISRIVAPLGWLAAIGVAVTLHEGWIDTRASDDVFTGVVAMLAAALLIMLLIKEERIEDVAERALAGGMGAAVAIGLAGTAFSLGVGAVPAAARQLLWWIALSALGGSIAGAALVGFFRGARRVDYDRPFVAPQPLTRRPLRVPSAAARRTPRKWLALMLHSVALPLARQVVKAIDRLLDEMLRKVNDARRAIAWLWQRAGIWAHRAAQLVAHTARAAAVALLSAATHVLRFVRRWIESTVLGAAVLAGASAGAIAACDLFESYLRHGSLLNGIGAYALALVAAAALVVLWWALPKQPLRKVAAGAQRNATYAGPSIFLTLVALGWVDGLVGIAGYSPIRPGVLTIAGTIVIAGSVAWTMRGE